MRIAMMTNNYKPFVGGVPISIERLADSLRDLGHSVYVFAPDYKSPVDDDEYTFRFPTMKHKIAGAIPIPNLIYGYVKNAISTLDIDLIHVHHPVMIGNVATRIGKEFHIPVVFTYHTRYEQYLHYLTPFGYLQNKANQGNLLGESILDFAQRQVIQRYLNRFLEKCDMVFAPTESIQNYLKPFHIDTPISIAPTGLPPACFENHIEATAIRKKYLQKKQYLFCTVSRLAKEKNLSFLLRGVSAVKKQLGDVFNVLILGDGPEKENLIALSQTLKIEENVFFIGEVSNHKISAYHQACDLFLFSSKSETQGIAVETAATLAEAREMIKQEAPLLICSDLCLPDGSGLELLAEVRTCNKDTPFIIASCYEKDDYEQEALQHGVTICMDKIKSALLKDKLVEYAYKELSEEQPPTFHKLLYLHTDNSKAEVLRAAMLQKGFNLILVNSLREAKHRLLEDKEIELILCDLSLPDGTALELFHDIRRISEKFKVNNPPIKLLPFFILTASTDLATEYQYRHEGVSDYITAPVNIPELIRRILFFVE